MRGKMMKVSLCLFFEERCKSVSSSCLNEKVVGMCLSCRDCVQGRTTGQVNTTSASHQECKKGTRSRALQVRYNSHLALLSLVLKSIPLTQPNTTGQVSRDFRGKTIRRALLKTCGFPYIHFHNALTGAEEKNRSTTAALLQTCGYPGIHFHCASTLFSRAEGSSGLWS